MSTRHGAVEGSVEGGETAPALLDRTTGQRLIGGLLVLVLILLVGSALWVSGRALNAFDELLLPEFDRDAELIAQRLASDLDRAAALGIAITDLDGMDGFLDTYLSEHPALLNLGISDGEGRLLAQACPARLASLAPPGLLPRPERRLVTVSDEEARRTTIRVGAAGAAYAHVHVGMDRRYAERQIADIRWDIVVVLVVSLLITFELLVFVIDRTMMTPLRLIDRAIARAVHGEWTSGASYRHAGDEVRGLLEAVDATGRRIHERLEGLEIRLARLRRVPDELAAQVDDLRRRLRWRVATAADRPVESRTNARFTLFLFVFAEELSRSFLPLYAQSVYVPLAEAGWLGARLDAVGLATLLTPEVVVGLPIIVFMAAIAIATPYGGSLVARHGSRMIFLVGVIPAIIGYLGTAFAVTVLDMLLWRMFSAVGYAFVTIACQGYLADLGTGRERARNMAVFVTAVTTAVICGSAIGAVLADRLGYRITFLVSAGFVLLAALLALRYLHDPAAGPRPTPPSVTSQFRAFANPRFLLLVLFIAIPAKVALTGFLFYTTPLYLASIGVSQSAIGRMIMLYGLLMLVGTQVGASLHERLGGGIGLVVLGGLLTGLALALPGLLPPELGMALAIAAFGLAQGMAAAPMLAILPELCPEESRRYGMTGLAALLRLAERVGSVIGPLLAAALVLRLGHSPAIGAIGAVSAASAAVFLLLMLLGRGHDRRRAE